MGSVLLRLNMKTMKTIKMDSRDQVQPCPCGCLYPMTLMMLPSERAKDSYHNELPKGMLTVCPGCSQTLLWTGVKWSEVPEDQILEFQDDVQIFIAKIRAAIAKIKGDWPKLLAEDLSHMNTLIRYLFENPEQYENLVWAAKGAADYE